MSAGCCDQDVKFEGLDPMYMRILWAVILINAAMFVIEMWGGHAADSRALEADALDFLGDSLTYGISLWAIGKAAQLRARIAVLKGLSLLVMGVYVFGKTAYEVFYLGLPHAELMGAIGFMALVANVVSVLLLVPYKDGDANVRSVWLCSRNDAIGNVIVLIAAGLVWGTATGWPDVIVAAIMAGLFINSAWQILHRAREELSAVKAGEGNTVEACHDPCCHGEDGARCTKEKTPVALDTP